MNKTTLLRRKRLAAGLCPYCGKRPRGAVGVRCGPCRKAHRTQAKHLREERAEFGQCVVAGCDRIPTQGRKKCQYHRIQQRRHDAAYAARLTAEHQPDKATHATQPEIRRVPGVPDVRPADAQAAVPAPGLPGQPVQHGGP